jgi:pimeloyl-ACP methyl ester carboxylesterase
MHDAMSAITIPILLLWGEHDGILPVALADTAFSKFGSSDKTLFKFQDSAHTPHIEEQDLFVTRVKTFVDEHIKQ